MNQKDFLTQLREVLWLTKNDLAVILNTRRETVAKYEKLDSDKEYRTFPDFHLESLLLKLGLAQYYELEEVVGSIKNDRLKWLESITPSYRLSDEVKIGRPVASWFGELANFDKAWVSTTEIAAHFGLNKLNVENTLKDFVILRSGYFKSKITRYTSAKELCFLSKQYNDGYTYKELKA